MTVSYGSGKVLEDFLISLREFHVELPVAVVDNKPDVERVADLAQKFDALYVPLPQTPGTVPA